ncbi:pentapeptide repeat-containing protein [Piscirickettsia salmonis]|uniref:pentapeptide repeat-containing protein n=2 Tax=Piscirickettsia salmonis TaxID=1238 RepID=UPI00166272FF|nr:pentapeptide repeat-containing protein [Piscirickettsia salmonis]QNR79620.1 pentapeptide repeat-containing protein [Piscirickettsia salmonis]
MPVIGALTRKTRVDIEAELAAERKIAVLESRRPELKNIEVVGEDLSALDLSGVHIYNSRFIGGVRFIKSNLRNACFNTVDMPHANLAEVCLSGAVFIGVDFSYASFNEAELGELGTRIEFRECNLDHSQFKKVVMPGVHFAARTTARGANFSRAEFEDGVIMESTFDHAVFESAELRNMVIAESCLKEATFFDVRARSIRMINVNCSQSNLIRGDFRFSDISRVIFDGSDCTDSRWNGFLVGDGGVSFKDAKLIRARFRGADEDFEAVNMRGVTIDAKSFEKLPLARRREIIMCMNEEARQALQLPDLLPRDLKQVVGSFFLFEKAVHEKAQQQASLPPAVTLDF